MRAVAAALALALAGPVTAQEGDDPESHKAQVTVAAAVAMEAVGFRPLLLELQLDPPASPLINARAMIGSRVHTCGPSYAGTPDACGRQLMTALVTGAQWYAASPHGLEVYGGPQVAIERVATESRAWWMGGVGGQGGLRVPVAGGFGAYLEANAMLMDPPLAWVGAAVYYRLTGHARTADGS